MDFSLHNLQFITTLIPPSLPSPSLPSPLPPSPLPHFPPSLPSHPSLPSLPLSLLSFPPSPLSFPPSPLSLPPSSLPPSPLSLPPSPLSPPPLPSGATGRAATTYPAAHFTSHRPTSCPRKRPTPQATQRGTGLPQGIMLSWHQFPPTPTRGGNGGGIPAWQRAAVSQDSPKKTRRTGRGETEHGGEWERNCIAEWNW